MLWPYFFNLFSRLTDILTDIFLKCVGLALAISLELLWSIQSHLIRCIFACLIWAFTAWNPRQTRFQNAKRKLGKRFYFTKWSDYSWTSILQFFYLLSCHYTTGWNSRGGSSIWFDRCTLEDIHQIRGVRGHIPPENFWYLNLGNAISCVLSNKFSHNIWPWRTYIFGKKWHKSTQ